MENRFSNMEKIDRYINGQLRDDENAEMRQRIAEDEGFRKLFDDLEIMAEGIRKSAAETSVEEKLAKLKQTVHLEEGFETDKSTNDPEANEEIKLAPPETEDPQSDNTFVLRFPVAEIFYRYKVAIAATVSLVVVAWFALNQLIPVSEEKLFAENFVPYPSTSGSTRGNTENDNSRDKAHLAYASENYALAVGFFEELKLQSDFSLTDRFYLGNAYLVLGDGEKAVETFSMVVAEGNGLKVLAQWYLGLSYLQLGDTDNTVEVLSEVRDAGVEKSEEAGEILKKLK